MQIIYPRALQLGGPSLQGQVRADYRRELDHIKTLVHKKEIERCDDAVWGLREDFSNAAT
jgi:hypothetical protein